ncbi:zinc finger protein 318 [Caerostris extrusa]|uniref:Zinc finger protein 318 n=1 Tax=Caerostris extrusa TaxID=172846 RepID=A0AAV4S270_CAEEX|nr:zinc finger protein 318 [Caerostris extrusa]
MPSIGKEVQDPYNSNLIHPVFENIGINSPQFSSPINNVNHTATGISEVPTPMQQQSVTSCDSQYNRQFSQLPSPVVSHLYPPYLYSAPPSVDTKFPYNTMYPSPFHQHLILIPQTQLNSQTEIQQIFKCHDPQNITAGEPLKNNSDKNVKLLPVRGVEFIMPVHAFYCSLCKEPLLNIASAVKHLKGHNHTMKYMSFLKENPVYEKNVTCLESWNYYFIERKTKRIGGKFFLQASRSRKTKCRKVQESRNWSPKKYKAWKRR